MYSRRMWPRWRLEVPAPRAQQVCDAPPSVLATPSFSRCSFRCLESCSAGGGCALYCETIWLPALVLRERYTL